MYLCISYIVKESEKKLETQRKKKKNVLIKKGELSILEIFKKKNPRDNNWLITRTL